MYYPYFRGKQFELITVRESAPLLAENDFVPIIEPVKQSLGGLRKALQAILDAGGRAVVVVNPLYGDHNEDGVEISQLVQEIADESDAIVPGILLRSQMSADDAADVWDAHADQNPVLIHAGFTNPKALIERLPDAADCTNLFIEEQDKILYRKHFEESDDRILIKDGFKRQRNADYPEVEEFSDLHVTYEDRGMDGFGDFLIVGDTYTEGGGPAYAVAIHLTFIDPENDDVMYIYHFVSDTKDTPTDPAGKFGQALNKLIEKLDSGTSHLLETEAIGEFRKLHEKGHFPGLGYVKKLSMKHHIETLADYLGE